MDGPLPWQHDAAVAADATPDVTEVEIQVDLGGSLVALEVQQIEAARKKIEEEEYAKEKRESFNHLLEKMSDA